MEYASGRFAGNPVLEEILNDPDTGTKKLAPGSPADAVRPVQQALLDLGWVERFTTAAGALLLPAQFVDGGYGQWSIETVTNYKAHYGIRFPPGDPNGFVDGFAGPRTMLSLDNHCALLDEADFAITQHAAELVTSGAVGSLDLAAADGLGRTTHPTRNSAAASRSATIDGAVGDLVYKRGLGAFAMWGQLFVEWVIAELAVGSGDATGNVGFPLADMTISGSVSSVQLELGVFEFDSATGVSTMTADPAASILRQAIEF